MPRKRATTGAAKDEKKELRARWEELKGDIDTSNLSDEDYIDMLEEIGGDADASVQAKKMEMPEEGEGGS